MYYQLLCNRILLTNSTTRISSIATFTAQSTQIRSSCPLNRRNNLKTSYPSLRSLEAVKWNGRREIAHSVACLFASPSRTVQQKMKPANEDNRSSIVESRTSGGQVSTHVSGVKRAKQAASDVSYTAIIALGGLALVGMFYYLFSELFSRETPTGIYDESSKFCVNNPEVMDALGVPIKVSAESGGRRVFQIRQKLYMEGDVLCLIINYYLEGPRNKGDVIVKVKKNASTGKFEYDYIVVKLEHPHRGQYKINVKPEL